LDVKSSYIGLIAAQKQVATYESGILKMSESLVDQVRQGYTLGANTIVDVVTAESTYRSVESAYYQAVGAYVQAAYTLKHAIGDLQDRGADLSLASIGANPNGSSSATGAAKPKEEKR
jgi:outer membrane protein TolC